MDQFNYQQQWPQGWPWSQAPKGQQQPFGPPWGFQGWGGPAGTPPNPTPKQTETPPEGGEHEGPTPGEEFKQQTAFGPWAWPFWQGTPFGQFGQNPFGQFGQSPYGYFGQNPFGQFGQSPYGYFGQNPFGHSGHSPYGFGNQFRNSPYGENFGTATNPWTYSWPRNWNQGWFGGYPNFAFNWNRWNYGNFGTPGSFSHGPNFWNYGFPRSVSGHGHPMWAGRGTYPYWGEYCDTPGGEFCVAA